MSIDIETALRPTITERIGQTPVGLVSIEFLYPLPAQHEEAEALIRSLQDRRKHGDADQPGDKELLTRIESLLLAVAHRAFVQDEEDGPRRYLTDDWKEGLRRVGLLRDHRIAFVSLARLAFRDDDSFARARHLRPGRPDARPEGDAGAEAGRAPDAASRASVPVP